MDFNKTSIGPVTPIAPAKHSVPIDDREAREKMLPGIPVALPDPASRFGGSTPDPALVPAPGIDTGMSLAAKLCWKIPKSPT